MNYLNLMLEKAYGINLTVLILQQIMNSMEVEKNMHMKQLVDIMRLDDPSEVEEVRALIQRHRDLTNSEVAASVLADWDEAVRRFRKVIAPAYRRVLELQQERSL